MQPEAMQRTRQRPFTLIELLVLIAIIGLEHGETS
jgi:prepilin-type N-terminal cleavage/methylation domain-containing protein